MSDILDAKSKRIFEDIKLFIEAEYDLEFERKLTLEKIEREEIDLIKRVGKIIRTNHEQSRIQILSENKRKGGEE